MRNELIGHDIMLVVGVDACVRVWGGGGSRLGDMGFGTGETFGVKGTAQINNTQFTVI